MEMVRVRTRPVAVGDAAHGVLRASFQRWRHRVEHVRRRVACGTSLMRSHNRRRRVLLRHVVFALQTEMCISIHK